MAPNSQPAGQPPGYRRVHPLVWILLGIGALILFAGMAAAFGLYFVAKKVASNPLAAASSVLAATNRDVEVVSRDDAGGTITIRDRNSGRTATLSLNDVKNGRIAISGNGREAVLEAGEGGIHVQSSDGGSVNIHGKLPGWVPQYPGANLQGSFSARGGDTQTASIAFTTRDEAEKVLAFYTEALQKAGFSVTATPAQQSGSSSSGSVVGVSSDEKRNLTVNVSADDEETTVGITWSGR